MKYRITITNGSRKNESWNINADSIESAAIKARRRVSGSAYVHVERVSGMIGKSGVFQCYKREKNNILNSLGSNFHVTIEQ